MINMQVLKSHMTTLKQIDRCIFCNNGEEALFKAMEIISIAADLAQNSIEKSVSIMPISLMLLDLQMPKMNGI